VQGLFACHTCGPQALKGVSAPVPVYRVLRESEAQSRFEAAVRTGLTPLVGRDEELGLLRRRWEQAKAGEGQAVLLSGEPGIGKSRLESVLKLSFIHPATAASDEYWPNTPSLHWSRPDAQSLCSSVGSDPTIRMSVPRPTGAGSPQNPWRQGADG
jgi:AAA ATPase-like protein